MTLLSRLNFMAAATALALGACKASDDQEPSGLPPLSVPSRSEADCERFRNALHTALQGGEKATLNIKSIISQPAGPMGVWGKVLDRSESPLFGFDFLFQILPSGVQDRSPLRCDTRLSQEEKDSVKRRVDQLVNGYVQVFLAKRDQARFYISGGIASEALNHKDNDLELTTLRAYYGEVPECVGREEMGCLRGKLPKSFTVSKHKFGINIANEVPGSPGSFYIPAR